MGFTPEQIKGRIKSIAKQNNADARTLMRIYMMERFLERLAQSEYRDNFIIKGGILVTAMIGVAHRSMRDFYDIRMLLDIYEDKVNKAVLKDALAATCQKRGTDHLQEQAEEMSLWRNAAITFRPSSMVASTPI